jgi:hypothetical protein
LLSSNAVEWVMACWIVYPNVSLISWSMALIGISSQSACDNDIYLASVVDRAISLWSFDVQRMGHLQKVMTYPERYFMLAGCIEVSCVHAPAKSASA